MFSGEMQKFVRGIEATNKSPKHVKMTAKLIRIQQQKMRHLPIHFILMLYRQRMRVIDELLRVEPLYSMLNDYSQSL